MGLQQKTDVLDKSQRYTDPSDTIRMIRLCGEVFDPIGCDCSFHNYTVIWKENGRKFYIVNEKDNRIFGFFTEVNANEAAKKSGIRDYSIMRIHDDERKISLGISAYCVSSLIWVDEEEIMTNYVIEE